MEKDISLSLPEPFGQTIIPVNVWHEARSLERSVDAYIKRGDDYLKRQNQEQTLFDND